MHFLAINSTDTIGQQQIPELTYACFYKEVIRLLRDPANRLVSYYGFKEGDQLRFMCAIRNSQDQRLLVGSYAVLQEPGILLASLSQHHRTALAFEQQIAGSLGITFSNLPDGSPQRALAHELKKLFSVN